MYTIILISLATAVTGMPQSCYDYCKLLSLGEIKDTTWGSNCACDLENENNFDKLYKTDNEMSTYKDESTIYYEPVELNYVPEISFIYQPYIILNPTLRDSSISEGVRSLPRTSNFNAIEAKHPDVKQSVKQKRQEADQTVNIETKGQPLYLDVDVKKPSNYGRTTQKELNGIENFDLTEQNLIDCVDLYMLIHFRKYDDISGLKSIWNDDKINKYNNLSSDDLMKEVEMKCSQPSNIVQQSFDEIKSTLPRKKTPYLRNNESFNMTNDMNVSKTENKTHGENQYVELFEPTANQDENLNSDSTVMNTERKALTNVVGTPDAINGIIEPLITTTSKSITTKLLLPRSTLKTYAEKNTDFENPDIIFTSTSTNTESKLQVSTDLQTDASSIYTEKLSSYVLQDDVTVAPTQKQQTSMNKSNETLFQEITGTRHEVMDTDRDTQSNIDQDNFNNTDLIINSENSTDTNTKTMIFQENRTVYPEIEIKIPKIVVKEYMNDTVFSETGDNEELLNGDFKDVSFNYTELTENTDMINVPLSYVNSKNSVNITDSTINSELQHSTEISTDPREISGNLYFFFDEKLVPARFVQQPNGNINLGIDGQSLCSKLTNDNKNHSSLLSILCNCTKSDNCTNNMLNEL